MRFKIMNPEYLYFVCILKICQNLYILNILKFLAALDIFRLSKPEECYFSFSINTGTQYRENGFEKRAFFSFQFTRNFCNAMELLVYSSSKVGVS